MGRYDHFDLFMKMLEVIERDLEINAREVTKQEKVTITNLIEKIEGTLVIQGEADMSGDKITIANVSNSVVNVKSILEQAQVNVRASTAIDIDARDHIADLVQEIGAVLAKVPAESAADAEAISDAIKDLLEKAARSAPNKKSIEISAKGLLEAAKSVAEALPIAMKIAAAVGGLFGIVI